MTEKELMLSGQLYIAADEELAEERRRARKLTRLINNTTEDETEERLALFGELLGNMGKNFWVETPFRCDYGSHIYIGDNFFANFDCIILDVCDVKIGNNVFFGPRVGIYAAGHPIDVGVRNKMLEYGKPVTIGNNVWVGGDVVITPGMTIGDNVVIGSGAVVTKDIPSGVIAAGNPCRIIRKITEEDKKYWEAQEEIYRKNKV